DAVVSPDAILATNTSSIPVIKVASATERPERVVGVHFFNPVPVMPLVEIISTLVTSEETADAVAAYAKDTLGKTVVRAGDRSGFIVNALLIPYLCQAVRMYDSGYASAEDIDAAMKGGCGYPMGPLTLLDTIGLDIALAAAESPNRTSPRPPCCAARSRPGTSARSPGAGSTPTAEPRPPLSADLSRGATGTSGRTPSRFRPTPTVRATSTPRAAAGRRPARDVACGRQRRKEVPRWPMPTTRRAGDAASPPGCTRRDRSPTRGSAWRTNAPTWPGSARAWR